MRRPGVRLGTVVVFLGLAAAAFGGFASTEVFFPAVGRVAGLEGAQFYTTIWVTNLSDADTVHFTFRFLKQGQGNAGSVPSFDDALAPGETKIYENVTEEKLGVSGQLGAARITADGEVFASERIYNQAHASDNLGTTEGLFFAAVPASFAIGLGESASVQGVNQGAFEDMRTNFALVETAGASATVHVALLSNLGATLGAADYPLQPFEQLQPNVAQLFPGISTINARLVATVTAGAGRVIIAAAQLANTSQDSSGFEMSFKDSLLGGGGATAGVASLNGLTGALSLVAGKNVTISKVGSTALKIDATGGGGTGLTLPFHGTVSSSDPAFQIDNSGSGFAIYGHTSGAIPAVVGASQSDAGVFGGSNASSGNTAGVIGLGTYASGVARGPAGVWGDSHDYIGVLGTSSESPGVWARSTNNTAIVGESQNDNAIYASNTSGVFPTIQALNAGGAKNAVAVEGIISDPADLTAGVKGIANSSTGYGIGVWGQADSGFAIFGVSSSGYAGRFVGTVWINGGVHTSSVGVVTFDDPRDPANATVSHAFVASSEMKNVYDGTATLDPSGVAEVVLPDWFETLNRDFRYQLTAIGTPQPGLFIAKKVADNRFRIAGGVPGAEVSWQITGVRKDPWASAHPIAVEKTKPDNERGYYIAPELYGQPKAKSAESVLRRETRVPTGGKP